MNKSLQKKLLILFLVILLGLVFQQIKFNQLAGTKVSFTLFDFFAPAMGALLGGPLGVLAIFSVSILNFLWSGFALEAGPIIRLFPTLFAVYYFSLSPEQKQSKAILSVPILCMIAFWLNPVGRSVWYYALYWLIPVVAYFKRNWLVSRALGATFTAHAVGGAAFIWAINIPASVWQGLIPVVAVERMLFALGISLSFILFTNLLQALNRRVKVKEFVKLEPKYIYKK